MHSPTIWVPKGEPHVECYPLKLLVVDPDYLPDSEVLAFSHVYTP
jgi:hypothetical protein